MRFPVIPLKHLAAIPITNGVGEAAEFEDPSWPRYVRTTDIADSRHLRGDTFRSLPPRVAGRAELLRGDLVMTAAGGVGKSLLYTDAERACYAGYLVRFRPRQGVSGDFVAYWAESQHFWDQIGAGKVVSTIDNFSAGKYQNLRCPSPPLEIQLAIAGYLDTETGRIDELITKKQRMVELLNERLAATRRTLLGSEPGWSLKRLLRAPMAYGILVPTFVEPETGNRMLRISNIDASGGVNPAGVAWVPSSLSDEYRRTVVAQGDVVLSVVGSMGRAAVVSQDDAGANLNRPLARLQPRFGVDPWMLWHWTQTTDFLDQARLSTGGGTAQPTLNLGDLAEFKVGLPSDPALWPGIAARLAAAHARHRASESMLMRQLELLKERRQALITAAVTGELEIPEVAA